ncbi:hypothetical protein LTR85_007521 [Meristemomyces frigidus]|nr:hypothetical protein LTR85_007521 [Meristemomyces frigidus]
MNNNQFRKLVMDTPARQADASPGGRPSATPSAFGAKKTSFMPMTPRTVKGGIDVGFARQVRERNAALRPTKKFKSYTPKGAKLAAGYTDRAKAREETDDEADSKAARIKALEEQAKLGQIPWETFEALRDQITGGDVSSTHLVKGLDRQLLERVRRGEDVLGTGGDEQTEAPPDVDDELDKLGEKEGETVKREKAEKKGTMAPPPVAGVKRSRDEIMAELRAQRQAAAQAKSSAMLDGRWRKVGEKEKSRVEIDSKGREVLITVDEDGVVKKRVRKAATSTAGEDDAQAAAVMPDASKAVLGADTAIPAQAPQAAAAEEDEDDDIFEGVGTEYNPLGNDLDDDDEEDSDDERPAKTIKPPEPSAEPSIAAEEDGSGSEPGEVEDPKPATAKRSYFKDAAKDTEEVTGDRFAGIENVLKKAANLDATRTEENDGSDSEDKVAREAKLKKRAAMLAQQDRDLDDMDMGFGSSRYEDEEDAGGEEKKIRLSEWKGTAGGLDDEAEVGKGGGGKKKRKPKKRKGDVNNAADIMRVIEGRKAGGGK